MCARSGSNNDQKGAMQSMILKALIIIIKEAGIKPPPFIYGTSVPNSCLLFENIYNYLKINYLISLFPDTELTKNILQQVIRGNSPGYFAKVVQRLFNIHRKKIRSYRVHSVKYPH